MQVKTDSSTAPPVLASRKSPVKVPGVVPVVPSVLSDDALEQVAHEIRRVSLSDELAMPTMPLPKPPMNASNEDIDVHALDEPSIELPSTPTKLATISERSEGASSISAEQSKNEGDNAVPQAHIAQPGDTKRTKLVKELLSTELT